MGVSFPAKAQLSDEDVRGLLADHLCCASRVSGNVPRDNAQIGELQALHTIHVKFLIHYTPLLLRGHLTGAERVIRRTHMLTNPFSNGLVILKRVFGGS